MFLISRKENRFDIFSKFSIDQIHLVFRRKVNGIAQAADSDCGADL